MGVRSKDPRLSGNAASASARRGRMSRAGAGCGSEGARGIELGLAAGGPERYHCPSVAAKLGPLVDRAAGALGGAIEQRTRSAIELWLQRLVAWNARIDLTAART